MEPVVNEAVVRPAALENVQVTDDFWSYYLHLVKDVVVPYQWEAINDRVEGAEPSAAVRNFRIAAGLEKGEFYGFVFQDSDVAKWLEAVGYLLAAKRDKALEQVADDMIAIIEQAQHKDGYLNTYYTIKEPGNRWTNLTECHELYCAGHMIEAGVAYYKATGKRRLLDIVCRIADNIADVFGDGPGQIAGYDGHQEIELALVKLYETTGEVKYLELSSYFIDQRGQKPCFFEAEADLRGRTTHWHKGEIRIDPEYFQAHLPIREQTAAVGHAVRVVYMCAGMADVAREKQDKSLLEACRVLWDNIVNRQMYITGGIGSSVHGEAFSVDYDLPNDTAYAETCASIGLIFFAHRMLQLEQKGSYADVMERALYNTVIAGMARDGKSFFYVNPLEVSPDVCGGRNKNYNHVKPVRQEWFGCACCPPNITRLLASLGQYIYSVKGSVIFAHLYIGGEAKLEAGGHSVTLKAVSKLPWEGDVSYTIGIKQPAAFSIALRIPSWSKSAKVRVNGEEYELAGRIVSGYAYIEQLWNDGDQLELLLEMDIMRVRSHPSVRANSGKTALQRGPLVYCVEQADNGALLSQLQLPLSAELSTSFASEMLGGVQTIQAQALRSLYPEWGKPLYRTDSAIELKPVTATFIPYYAWANRGLGEMAVWVKESF